MKERRTQLHTSIRFCLMITCRSPVLSTLFISSYCINKSQAVERIGATRSSAVTIRGSKVFAYRGIKNNDYIQRKCNYPCTYAKSESMTNHNLAIEE